MSSSEKKSKIGFPEGLLTDKSIRIDILDAVYGKYAIIDKPADILFDSYIGAPKTKSIMLAMRQQAGKNEFERLGIKSPYAINQIDYEYSGIALMAMDKEIATSMRNAMWSGKFEFEFLFLTRAFRKNENEFQVDLPILMHEERPVWIVSHRFGKKAKTSFKLVTGNDEYQLWSATTNTLRPHQVRLHAAEAGLDIIGEWIYSKTPYIFLSKLKGEYKLGKDSQEKALYPHLAIHLSSIKFNGNDIGDDSIGEVSIKAELPKGFKVMLKKLNITV